MSKPLHTPTPWHSGGEHTFETVYAEDGYAVSVGGAYRRTREERKANAELTVKAVNNHDQFVSLALRVVALLDEKSEAHNELLEIEHDSACAQERAPSMDNIRSDILKQAQDLIKAVGV